MHNNFRKENLRVFQVKPLSCIECNHPDTIWIPFYQGTELTHTVLVCEKCSHRETLKQKAFQRLFEHWLKIKMNTREFELGLSKLINSKN